MATLRSKAPAALEAAPGAVRDILSRELVRYPGELEQFPRDDEQRFLLTYGASFWKVLVRRNRE